MSWRRKLLRCAGEIAKEAISTAATAGAQEYAQRAVRYWTRGWDPPETETEDGDEVEEEEL